MAASKACALLSTGLALPRDAAMSHPPHRDSRLELVGIAQAAVGVGAAPGACSRKLQVERRRPWLLVCSASTGEQEMKTADSDSDSRSSGEEDFGEVERILGSRVQEGGVTQYLIQWKDEHPDSWEPKENLSEGIIEDYESPWWTSAKKGDDVKLKELLTEGRDPNSIDENGRTAIFFSAGFGHEKATQVLIEFGSDLSWQDVEGFTPLHMAAGYVQTPCVRMLLEAGADPEIKDDKERSSLDLAKDLLEKLPVNPTTLARKMGLSEICKLLDEAVFEEVEVEQVLDRRIGEGGVIEYLVRWSDDSEDTWEPTANIGEDLVKDFEEGLEYGIAEKVLEKRDSESGKTEYLVKWVDSDENTWEPAENLAVEVIAEFEGVSVGEMEKKLTAAA